MEEVSDRTFREKVIEISKQGIPVLVVAYADGCPNSQRILKTIESENVEQEYAGKAKIVEIMIENKGKVINPLIQGAFDVSRYPKLVIFKNGRLEREKVSIGSAPCQAKDVRDLINKVL